MNLLCSNKLLLQTLTPMQKIYTQFFHSRVDLRADILYPVSLFFAACVILVLSSFGTKATFENEPNNLVSNLSTELSVEEDFASCCTRTVHNTVTADRCNGNSANYVFYLANKASGENRSFKGTNLHWEECDNGTARFTAVATHGASGTSYDLDVTFSGGTSNPPADSPKANHCESQSGMYYYTSTTGTAKDRTTGEVITFTRSMEAFQIGNGGNVVAKGYGASGWIDPVHNHWDTGDINLMLGKTCTPSCDQKVTINNNGTCPIEIYKWVSGGDVYEATIAAGGTITINTEIGLMWRATDAPEPDFHNLKFDKSYTSTDGCDQVWNLSPSYCDLDCTPNCRNNDPCDAVAGFAINNINPTCSSVPGSGVLFQKECGGDFTNWSSGGDLFLYEFADGTAKIIGTVTSGGKTGHLDMCLDQKSNTGNTWTNSCYTNGLSGTQRYYNCFGGTLTINGKSETIHRRGSGGYGFIIGNGAGNNSGLGMAAWTGGSFGSCTEWFSKLTPIDVGCCNTLAVDAGGDVEICAGEEVDLTATATGAKACNGNTNNQYSWSGPGIVSGGSSATVTVNQAGTYTVVVTDCSGCEATDMVVVGNKAAVDAAASNDGPITCLTPNITITALPNGNTYSWTGPGGFTSTQQSPQVGVAGTYTVTVSSADGCESTAETIVEADEDAPAATATNGGAVCDGGSATISGSSTSANVSYAWTGEGLNANQQTSQNNTITGLLPGSYDYVLTVTNEDNGCTATATTTVIITANPASGISAQEQVCAGEDAQFSAVPPVTGATYAWEFSGPATPASANTAVATVVWADVPGNYTATLTVENDGCISTYIHEITVTAEVRANAGPDQTICQGGTAKLDASDSQGNGYLWTVVTGDPTSIDLGGTATAATVSPLVTTTYKLQVDDVANNCTKVDEVTVFVDVRFNPIADAGGPSITICEGDKITLDGSGSLPPPAEPGANISYFWSPAQLLDNPISATPMATISETTTFELIVSTENGCRDTSTVEIIVAPCDVSIEKTVSNAAPNVGETITFTITATNEGDLPLSGIEIQDNVPNGYTSVTNVSNGGSSTTNVAGGFNVTWSGISLPASGTTSVTFDAVVGTPGANVNFRNTAQVTTMDQLDVDSTPNNDDGDQSEDDEDSVDVDPAIADLNLVKSVDDATPSVGDVVTFSITVSNDGPDNATGITVADAVPNGYTNISANGGSVTGNTATWTGVSVAANSSTTLTLTAEVLAPDANTSYVNVAEITAVDQYDPDSAPNNGADTDGDGIIGSEDPDGTQDPDDEDDGDDAGIVPNGSIWGAVLEDTDDNGTGDSPIAGVTVILKDATGNVVATAVTDADGKYDFLDLVPGDYTVEQTQPAGFDDVSDQDGSPDGDTGDSDSTVDNSIAVTVDAGEADMDNDFVEELLTSIWGDVTEDLNGDGIGDDPIPGVTITLKDAAGNVVATAVTDADGKYDFVDLPAGVYTVEETQPPAFQDVSDQDGSPDGDPGDNDSTVDNSITVTTVPGEADMDNDFVEVGLTSIWGSVTEDTNDDDSGDIPIAGVTITLKDASGNVLQTAVTDADGKYDFVGLPPGDYIVEQSQPAGFDDVSDQDGSPDGDAGDGDDTVDNSIAVTTTGGEADMDNDFVEELLTSIWGAVLEDIDGDGTGDAPLEGVAITLKDGSGNIISATVTDADGKYDFVDLPAGDYILEENQPQDYRDVSDQDGSPDGDVGDSDTAVDNKITVTTVPGEADMDNDFIEEGLTSIWGSVTEDTNNDGSGDSPIAGVTITLKDAVGNVLETAVTDADGKYDFVGLRPGNYTVEQSQPAGYENVSDQDGSPDGDAGDSDTAVDNSISVTTTTGEADMDNDFVESLLTSIWGDVTEDTNGDGAGDAPIAGVTITLKDASGTIIATDVTDADGKYDFINLPAGDYTVEETQPAEYQDVSDQDESPDGDAGDSDTTVDNSIAVTTLPGEADMDNDFVEEGLTSIWGDVTEDTDGDGTGDAPIAGVTITLKDANGVVVNTAVTDADGKYDFVGLPAGDYTVEQSQPSGFGDVSDQDESPDGDAGDSDTTVDNVIAVTTTANEADMDNDFIEEKFASISGVVLEDTDGDGQGDTPLPGVTITLKDASGNVVGTAVSDAQGFYNFIDLVPGVYTLEQTDLPGYEDVSDTDTNTPGNDTDGANDPQDDAIPVVLTPGETDDGNDFVERGLTSIWGDVTEDLNGDGTGDQPISGVTITLKDASGNVIDTKITDADGKYDFTGLPAGDYTVEQSQPAGYNDVSDQDESPDGDAGDSDTTVDNSIAVTTTAGEADMDNDFIEEQLSSISGTVSEDTDNDDLGDRPLAGVTVELRDAAGNLVASAVTDSNGNYEFLNVVPGDYTLVQVQQPGYENVSDEDGSPDPDGGNDPVDNEIPVTLAPGENDVDNDFIDEQLVSIGSTVFEDTNNNGRQDAGEPGVAGVDVAVFLDADADGLPDSATPEATDVTDANGNYYLGGLEPGKYVVVAQAPAGLDNSSSFTGSDDGVDGDDNGDQPLGPGNFANSGTIMLVPDTEPTNESGSGGNQESVNGDQDDDGDMTIDFGFYGGASLGDFVWFDLNGDGNQDAGEPGLQNVTVNLLDAAGNVVQTTTSGNNGEYNFAGLAPGDYIVEFITPTSYTEVVQTSGTTPGNSTTNSDYDPATGRTALITVGSGDAIEGVDAGFNLLLDVSLMSFTGRYVEDREIVSLEWITSNEVNADYFIVERSIDNGAFENIGRVEAKGNTNTESLYSHLDENITNAGSYLYRLVQVAKDGSQDYSDVVSVTVRRSYIAEPSVKVFPNPVYDIVNVDIVKNENDAVSVKLFDLTGKAISMNSINIIAKGNSASIQVPVQDLPRAAYILRINVGDQVFAKKITLVR